MTGENAADAASARPLDNKRDRAAWASAIIACALLLAAVRYCPSYEAFKISLLQAWTHTFWTDLSTQISGLFSAAPKTTLSGENVASEWTYCGLVPPIVAWLVWRLWPQLRAAPVRPHVAGYWILATGFFLYLAGFLMENYYVGMGSMEFIYAGLIVLYLGWPIMRLLLFPWAFLMFMWPYNFMEDVALDLRLVMSSMSHHVLQIIGVPNVLQGTSILSTPDAAHSFAIDIADPCSGIRSLFALVMIAALFAFISFEKLWQQAVIVVLAVPLVIFGNLVRILLLALATTHFGEAFALGTNEQPSWFHELAGYLVYAINFGGLILAGSILTHFTSPSPEGTPFHDDARE
jgi:exosortase